MEKLKTARGIAKGGAILLKIAEIFCIIGAVGCLVGIICLAVLPADLMQVELSTAVDVKMNLADWLGRENWERAKESAAAGINAADGQEVTVTDDGVEVKTDVNKALTRGDLALSIAPAILTLAVSWYFCRTLGKLLRDIRDGGEPFRKENADLLRACGITLFVGSAAPAVVYGVIGFFAQTTESPGIDLTMVFTGLMLFGLAALFEVADARRDREAPPAPFTGYTGFAAPASPAAEAPKPEEIKSEEVRSEASPAEETPKNDPPFDPNAF